MAEKGNPEDDRSGEIDFSDPRVVEDRLGRLDSRLDDSDRAALAEQISRQFRRAPADAQARGLDRTRKKLNWVLDQMQTQESDEVRLHGGQLRKQILNDVEGLVQGIVGL